MQDASVSSVRIGIDTGGTFTDFVFVRQGRLCVHKEPSTPDNPAEAVIQGLERLLVRAGCEIVHGSTVATNALLERKGARTALVTTAGFEDLLFIGRQTRRDIYDIDVTGVEPLVPPELCFGARQRTAADGSTVTALKQEEAERIADRIADAGVEAVAVCFLHSYADPSHERMLANAIEKRFDGFISISHQVLPEFREYERCSTTTINAYVGPLMSAYLDDLKQRSGAAHLHVLQSNGGALALETARRHAVHTILSGPAGGVVGAFEVARSAGFDQAITFDMGGTSTDVSLCPGRLTSTNEALFGGMPVRVPVLDIHTVGAGGGSIAHLDRGGALRVGPNSAGAVPGPVCYGRGGTEVTVTDANLILGRLSPAHFLDGATTLDVEAATAALENAAGAIGMEPWVFAEGVLAIVNAAMEGAIRVISVERGHDPRDFTLVCFGGAGGMHAAALAQALAIPRVLVPPAPGALSASGMLLADSVRDYSRTLLQATEDVDTQLLENTYQQLEERALSDPLIGRNGDSPGLARSLDLRYRGQGFEINVPFGPEFAGHFHTLHEQRYGYADRARPTEIVTLRLQARSPTGRPDLAPLAPAPEQEMPAQAHTMVFDGARMEAQLVPRSSLAKDKPLRGPALVVEYSATTVLPPDWTCRVEAGGNLILERQRLAPDRG